ncbi:MAG TPA: hypothetical protein VGK74_19340 [Symbiobacteriaceae bacterium]
MTAPDKTRPKSKPPKPKRDKRPFFLILLALLLVAAAAVVNYVPIPGLTAPSKNAAAATDTSAKTKAPETPAKDPQAERELALTKKEADLANREAVLKEKETKANALLKELTVQQSDAETARRISGIYGAMPPGKAAPLLATFDAATAAQIIRLLSEDQAAAIFAAMAPNDASAIMKELLKHKTTTGNG